MREENIMTIRELKKGEFFTKKDILHPNETQVWIKGDYDRALKRYECTRFSDCNDMQYIRGDKEVYTNLIF